MISAAHASLSPFEVVRSKKVENEGRAPSHVEINRFAGARLVAAPRLIYRGITLTLRGFIDCGNSFGKFGGEFFRSVDTPIAIAHFVN